MTIIEASEGLKKKNFSARDLLEDCYRRIEQVDNKIHAFLALNKELALQQAGEVEKILNTGQTEKPLLGIPVAIKDNFNTVGLTTTASSNILINYQPPYNATVVNKLRDAGAIILGKTNMDAFAHGSSTETSDFGSTKNPWNLNYLPGGSSGGSAAAVAANETIFAVGSETAGSIRQPAAWCGVVGFKPTYGRISRFGLIAMASSTDSPGPLTKSVADAKLIYKILAGFDENDATTAVNPVNYKTKNIRELKIGIPKEYYRSETQKGINEMVLASAKILEKLGARIIELSLLDPEYAISDYTVVQRAEVSSNLARFDGIRFGGTRDNFNEENMRRIMLGTYTLSAGYYDAYYKRAQKVRTLIVNNFNRAWKEVDLLLAPTSPTVAQKIGATKGQAMYGEISDMLVEPSSIAGLPGINLPCGFIEGLPVGMQIIGPQWSEDLILYLAEKYEDNTEWHRRKALL